jgi:hypothetical protein
MGLKIENFTDDYARYRSGKARPRWGSFSALKCTVCQKTPKGTRPDARYCSRSIGRKEIGNDDR